MGNHHMGIEGGRNMGRRCFGLMALVLGLAMPPLGFAVAAEPPQGASDGSECKAEERLAAIYEVSRQLHRRAEHMVSPDQWAEQEQKYRELTACLKPALLAGSLADPKDDRRFADAMRAREHLLRHRLNRKDEADALRDELIALSDAGVLKDPLVQIRINRLNRILESGDLTLARELAEAMISRARAMGITHELIRQKQETNVWTPKLGPDGRVDDVWAGNFANASIALEKLDEIEKMFQTRVCGKVTLAKGDDGPITATIVGIAGEKFVRVGPDGGYCLPVQGKPASPPEGEPKVTVYIFLTAAGYHSQVRMKRFALGKDHSLAEASLASRDDPALGSVVGAVFRAAHSRRFVGISATLGHRGVTVQGSTETYRTTTDENGMYSIEVPAGTYHFTTDEMFPPRNITVNPGETVIQIVTVPGAME